MNGPRWGLKIGIGDTSRCPPPTPSRIREIHLIFQQHAKAASDTTHFHTHPERPVSDARWRTAADEDTTVTTHGRVR
jgi:hypothetical protein